MNVTVTKKNESVIYNGRIYTHGESFTVDEVIGKSLMERGYVTAEEEDEAELLDGHLDEKQLQEMSYADLKSLAAQMGLDAKGKKEELIARITAASAEDDAEAELESEGDESTELPQTGMPE